MDIVAVFKYQSAAAGIVFNGNNGESLSGYQPKFGLYGFLFHYRVFPFEQERLNPVIGFNYNYFYSKWIDYNGMRQTWTSYDLLMTFGIQWSFAMQKGSFKNFRALPELGMGMGSEGFHLEPGSSSHLSLSAKLSLYYLFCK